MSLLPTFSLLGSGPTVLLLHDADGDHLSFAPLQETLAGAGCRAVAWDMPGYGRSAPVEPYAFKGLAQRCLLLLDALQCEEATLVGHGMGAMLALELALRAPLRVRRLALCAGGPPLDASAVAAWVAPRLALLDEGLSMGSLAERLVARDAGSGALPEGLQLARHAMGRVHAATYRHALQALAGFARSAPELMHVRQPTLLIAGEEDRCTPPEALLALAHVLRDARVVQLAGVGHWPQLEDPEGFEAALLDFLSEPHALPH
ncbi:MAG: alpha/beta fold hydrolase [Proteobacteria bacterium]|nr:alpha/beta fold hydrolase [Pseudomonadota bacterium]MBS0493372.1 alpha/beta fold hydrolase [Pseudomonadota bacterium]